MPEPGFAGTSDEARTEFHCARTSASSDLSAANDVLARSSPITTRFGSTACIARMGLPSMCRAWQIGATLGATPGGHTRSSWGAERPYFTGLSRSHFKVAEREGLSTTNLFDKHVPPRDLPTTFRTVTSTPPNALAALSNASNIDKRSMCYRFRCS
jgi:hypothetical protein